MEWSMIFNCHGEHSHPWVLCNLRDRAQGHPRTRHALYYVRNIFSLDPEVSVINFYVLLILLEYCIWVDEQTWAYDLSRSNSFPNIIPSIKNEKVNQRKLCLVSSQIPTSLTHWFNTMAPPYFRQICHKTEFSDPGGVILLLLSNSHIYAPGCQSQMSGKYICFPEMKPPTCPEEVRWKVEFYLVLSTYNF